jgi:hypothetical protein
LQDCSVIKTKEDYLLLEKAYKCQPKSNLKAFWTIVFFFIGRDLPQTLTLSEIQNTLHSTLDDSFSLQTLYTKENYVS